MTVSVLSNGWMEIRRAGSPDTLLCTAAQTAMWVSLSRAQWVLGDAALELARAWQADPWVVRDRMTGWLAELAANGFVRLLDRP